MALSAIGIVLLLAMVLVVVQSGPGWSWVPSGWRRLASVDARIWSALATGLLAYLVSAWVRALKPADPAASLFAVSGVATLVFCYASFPHLLALSLPDAVVSWSWIANMLGASTFGIAMTCLFLVYPGRLPRAGLLAAGVVLGFGGWTLLRTVGPWRDFAAVQRITTLEMLAIIVAVACQWRAAAGDPRQRAIALWLGASVLVGAGAFIATVALPLTLGFAPLVRQHHAFLFFLAIYAGVAVGLMRYRLFDLGTWAYRLLWSALALLLLVAVDVFLATVLAFGWSQATGMSLLLAGIGYLGIREWLWRRLPRTAPARADAQLQKVVEAALQHDGRARAEAWQALLREHFHPLELAESPAAIDVPAIAEEGLALTVPGALGSPAVMLRYRNGGRALFRTRDAGAAAHLVRLAGQVEEGRDAYERGVAAERSSISRELHDNIGAQLMRALHSDEAQKKDAMIRDTLADLRDVVNQAYAGEPSLDDVLADLRAETADRLEEHGLALEWSVAADAVPLLSPTSASALRLIVREAASRTIGHGRASRFRFDATVSGDRIHLDVGDDGAGSDAFAPGQDHGIAYIVVRIEGLGGVVHLHREPAGSRMTASLPLVGAQA